MTTEDQNVIVGEIFAVRRSAAMDQRFRSVDAGEDRRFLNETREFIDIRFGENFTMQRSPSAVVMIFDKLPDGTFEQSEQEKHSIVRPSALQTVRKDSNRNEFGAERVAYGRGAERGEEEQIDFVRT